MGTEGLTGVPGYVRVEVERVRVVDNSGPWDKWPARRGGFGLRAILHHFHFIYGIYIHVRHLRRRVGLYRNGTRANR
jgi:hypothetical protein